MALYFVDYENVGVNGLEGIIGLKEGDYVTVFYGLNAKTIPFEKMVEVTRSKAVVEFSRTDKTAKNYLDFQLSTYVGFFLGKGESGPVYVISNDTGFDSVVDFWTDHNVEIHRYQNIAGMAPESEAAKTRSRRQHSGKTKTQEPAEAAQAARPVQNGQNAQNTQNRQNNQNGQNNQHKQNGQNGQNNQNGRQPAGDVNPAQAAKAKNEQAANGKPAETPVHRDEAGERLVEAKSETAAGGQAAEKNAGQQEHSYKKPERKHDHPDKKQEKPAPVNNTSATAGRFSVKVTSVSTVSGRIPENTAAVQPAVPAVDVMVKGREKAAAPAESVSEAAAPAETAPAAAANEEAAPAEKKKSRNRRGNGKKKAAEAAAQNAAAEEAVKTEVPAAEKQEVTAAPAEKQEVTAAPAEKPVETVQEPPKAPETHEVSSDGKQEETAARKEAPSARQEEKTAGKKDGGRRAAAVPESARKKVREALKEDKLPANKYSTIYKLMESSQNKQHFHGNLLHTFGQENGKKIYDRLKNIFEEQRVKAAETV